MGFFSCVRRRSVRLLKLEGGTAGRLQSTGAVAVRLRREDESHHFNSYISSPASRLLSVSACVGWKELQREKEINVNTCVTTSSFPALIQMSVCSRWGGGVSAPFTRTSVNTQTRRVSTLILKQRNNTSSVIQELRVVSSWKFSEQKAPMAALCISISLFPLKK